MGGMVQRGKTNTLSVCCVQNWVLQKYLLLSTFDRSLCKKPFAMSSILSSCIFDLTEISKLDMHTSYSKTLQYHIWDKTNNADFPSLTKAGNDIDAKLQTATSWTISRYERSSIPDLKRNFEHTRFDNSNMPDFAALHCNASINIVLLGKREVRNPIPAFHG